MWGFPCFHGNGRKESFRNKHNRETVVDRVFASASDMSKQSRPSSLETFRAERLCLWIDSNNLIISVNVCNAVMK